jgi:nucleotide-binding universal stress UspA family protein
MTRIVVGVDGSAGSQQALSWAIEEAERRGATVTAVAAWSFPPLAAVTPIPSPTLDEFRTMAEDTLDGAVAELGPVSVPLSKRVVQGNPAAVLAAEGAGADLLVVGRRGRGGFERLALGSVGRGTIRRSHVPVVVVPDHPAKGALVVVGIQGRGDEHAVIAAGADAARSLGVPCLAVHAVELGLAAVGLGGGEASEALVDAGSVVAARAARELADRGVEATASSAIGSGGAVLLDAASSAALLVVGRPAHGIIGSVTDACAAHATCPVLVVPNG